MGVVRNPAVFSSEAETQETGVAGWAARVLWCLFVCIGGMEEVTYDL